MLAIPKIAAAMGGNQVLKSDVRSLADLHQAVEGGLPKGALQAVVGRVFPAGSARREAIYAIVPEATFKRRRDRLSLVESERTERLARIVALSEDVLGDEEDSRTFLTSPHPLLDGKTPFEVAATDLGARRVERILHSIEHGLPV